MPRILEERNAAEAKVAEYERIFAEIWGNAMTDCGPEDYALFPEMLALHDKLRAATIKRLTEAANKIKELLKTRPMLELIADKEHGGMRLWSAAEEAVKILDAALSKQVQP